MREQYLKQRTIPAQLICKVLGINPILYGESTRDDIHELAQITMDAHRDLSYAQREVFTLRADIARLHAENAFLLEQLQRGSGF